MTADLLGDDWVPEACTLPTVEQPLRRAEFDELFAHDVLRVLRRPDARVELRLRPDAAAAARAAGLAVRETGCCSFFTFDLAVADGQVSLLVGAAPAHADVLSALAARAEAAAGSRPTRPGAGS